MHHLIRHDTYLSFLTSRAPVKNIILVTETLQKINPDLGEAKRTRAFSSLDRDVNVSGEISE